VCGLGADGAKLSKQIVCVVEHIEEFRAEFEMFLFVDRKLFDQRGVPGLVSGAFDDVASGVAEGSKVRIVRKRAGVEQSPRDARLGVGITDQVGA